MNCGILLNRLHLLRNYHKLYHHFVNLHRAQMEVLANQPQISFHLQFHTSQQHYHNLLGIAHTPDNLQKKIHKISHQNSKLVKCKLLNIRNK